MDVVSYSTISNTSNAKVWSSRVSHHMCSGRWSERIEIERDFIILAQYFSCTASRTGWRTMIGATFLVVVAWDNVIEIETAKSIVLSPSGTDTKCSREVWKQCVLRCSHRNYCECARLASHSEERKCPFMKKNWKNVTPCPRFCAVSCEYFRDRLEVRTWFWRDKVIQILLKPVGTEQFHNITSWAHTILWAHYSVSVCIGYECKNIYIFYTYKILFLWPPP